MKKIVDSHSLDTIDFPPFPDKLKGMCFVHNDGGRKYPKFKRNSKKSGGGITLPNNLVVVRKETAEAIEKFRDNCKELVNEGKLPQFVAGVYKEIKSKKNFKIIERGLKIYGAYVRKDLVKKVLNLISDLNRYKIEIGRED